MAADALSEAVAKDVPALKKTSADIYKKLYGGFQFKGYEKSPGHQAILQELKNFYKLVKKFSYEADGAKVFPQTEFEALKVSRDRVEELAKYVILEEELVEVLALWLVESGKFTGNKETKEKEIKVEKIEKETKKIEAAIKFEGQKEDLQKDMDLAAKEARLRALRDHYRLIQNQNRTIIRAGYSTPGGFYNSFNGGYYHNNGTYYPRNNSGHYNSGHNHNSNYNCNPKRPIINVRF